MDREDIVKRASKMKPPKPKFGFGKHKGHLVETVLRSDPEYIVWAWRNVAKSYLPFGKDVFEQAYGFVKDMEYEYDDSDEMDDPVEQWARGIADE